MSVDHVTHISSFFKGDPDFERILSLDNYDLASLSDKQLRSEYHERELFQQTVNIYATGRTTAGKTTVGNSLIEPKEFKVNLSSTGELDCTNVVQYFKTPSNIIYYDLPGSCSNDLYENINRAVLNMSQLKVDDDADFIQEIPMRDYTDYDKTGLYTENSISVVDWESDDNKKKYSPDVILYVFAAHRGFFRDDKNYLEALLASRESSNDISKVIFVINIFGWNKDVQKATTQDIQNIEDSILKAYAKYTDFKPVILKIDAMEAKGLADVTKAICDVLPSSKIGQVSDVLQSDLKSFALQERKKRFHTMLCTIAAKMAFVSSEEFQVLKDSLLFVFDYGLRIFFGNALDLNQAEPIIDGMVKEIQAERSKPVYETVTVTKVRTETEKRIVGTKDIYETVTVNKPVIEKYIEEELRPIRSFFNSYPAATYGIVKGAYDKVTGSGSFSDSGEEAYEAVHKALGSYKKVNKERVKEIEVEEEMLAGAELVYDNFEVSVPYENEEQKYVETAYYLSGQAVCKRIFVIGLGIVRSLTYSKEKTEDYQLIIDRVKSEVSEKISELDVENATSEIKLKLLLNELQLD